MKAANRNLNLLLPVLVLAEISLTMADKYLYPQEQNLESEEKENSTNTHFPTVPRYYCNSDSVKRLDVTILDTFKMPQRS